MLSRRCRCETKAGRCKFSVKKEVIGLDNGWLVLREPTNNRCRIHKSTPIKYNLGLFPIEIWEIIFKDLSILDIWTMISVNLSFYEFIYLYLAKSKICTILVDVAGNGYPLTGYTHGDALGNYKIIRGIEAPIYSIHGNYYLLNVPHSSFPNHASSLYNFVSIANDIISLRSIIKSLFKYRAQIVCTFPLSEADSAIKRFCRESMATHYASYILSMHTGVFGTQGIKLKVPSSYTILDTRNCGELLSLIAKKIRETHPNLFLTITVRGTIIMNLNGVTSI